MDNSQDKYKRNRSMRYNVDLIRLSKSISEVVSYNKSSRARKSKGIIFTLLISIVFFSLGYLIAALYIPIWIKLMIFLSIAILGFIFGYLVAFLFR